MCVRGLLVLDGQPECGASTACLLCVRGECAEGGKLFERSIDAFPIDVAIEETADLIPREPVGGGLDGLANAVGDGVSGGQAEEADGASVAIGPYCVGCFEVGEADNFATVERGIEGAEAQDLGLAAACGCTPQAGITIAERLITICPKLLSLLVAAKEDFGARGGPGNGVPHCAGGRYTVSIHSAGNLEEGR